MGLTKLFKEYLRLLENNFLIIGPSQAGKTSILYRLKTGKFLDNVKPTVGLFKDIVKNNLILEIGGQISYRHLWKDALKNNPHVILFVIDITRPDDFECFKDFLLNCKSHSKILLIANKIDLQQNMSLDLSELPSDFKKEILFCSAKTGENIWRLGEYIAELGLEGISETHNKVTPSYPKEKSLKSLDNDKEIQSLLDDYNDKF